MTGLSIGMLIYVTDQFVSTETCAPVDLIFNVAPPRGVTVEAPIDPNVVICHATRCKALLEPTSHLAAIQRSHPHRSDTGLIDIVDDHAGDALVDHLWDRAGAIGEYWSSARHSLNRDETERLRPTDRKQQSNRIPQERPLVLLVNLTLESNTKCND
jgi:hypothetical protein